ncbi:ECF transporter S component [Papillibacter cinnamivorans]|uniref:ECF transporter S component n=1 Tax=Papillibacter cinnamivorans TaxID=100176 RepID=UPI001FA87203|nr:ECF transporter S component [Papillibacter cinnamivorans]
MAGVFLLGDRKYYFVSLLMVLYALILFGLAFERRRPQARELVIAAVLTALSVAGRSAFFMLPQFKPVAAIVIIAGVCMGGETGFLVGALTGFISGFLFGQGPWTPWQMLCFGGIGLLAGALVRQGILRRDRLSLCIYGGLSTFLLYGGVMDLASVLMTFPRLTWQALLASYAAGLWFNLVHALSTVFFLFVLSKPMIEKLDRIKVKYGLMEP